MDEESKAAMADLLQQREDRQLAKLQKHQEIKKKIQERSQKIKKNYQETNIKYAEVLKKDVLHKKMETKFHSEFEAPLLEERKKKLEQMRNFHKPI